MGWVIPFFFDLHGKQKESAGKKKEIHKEIYIYLKDNANDHIAKSKAAYFNDVLQSSDQKTVFSTLNQMLNDTKKRYPTSVLTGQLVEDSAMFFESKILKHIEVLEHSVCEQVDIPSPKSTSLPLLDVFHPVTIEDLTKVVNGSANKTAPLTRYLHGC
jgi:hypothetical protein